MASNRAFLSLLGDATRPARGAILVCIRCQSRNHDLPDDLLCYGCRQELMQLTPVCCVDAAGGEMVREGNSWTCVWCERVAPLDEPVRQWRPATRG